MYSVVLIMSLTSPQNVPEFGCRHQASYCGCYSYAPPCYSYCGPVVVYSSYCGSSGYLGTYPPGVTPPGVTQDMNDKRITPETGGKNITPDRDRRRITPDIDGKKITPGSDDKKITPDKDNKKITPDKDNKKITPGSEDKKDTSGNSAARSSTATVIVSLPADATLSFEGIPTRKRSSERLFITPPLEKGSDYFYNVEATIVRDGTARVLKQRVNVNSGKTTRVTFDFAQVTSVASK
jgi:uncharacterized protein (TIGR03000 family)